LGMVAVVAVGIAGVIGALIDVRRDRDEEA
jgi:hypothetical protein